MLSPFNTSLIEGLNYTGRKIACKVKICMLDYLSMLTKFRAKHIKKILLALTFIIVPSFVIWGSLYYFRSRQVIKVIASYKGKKITTEQFAPFIRLAQINLLLTDPKNYNRVKKEDIQKDAWMFFILLDKAKEDKLSVSDKELAQLIEHTFSYQGKFSKKAYHYFLRERMRLPARIFEDALRNILLVDKEKQKIFSRVTVNEKEIYDFYRKLNDKMKVSYIFISYKDLRNTINPTKEELASFYNKNKSLFREKPKVKLRYVILDKKNITKFPLSRLKHMRTLEEIAKETKTAIKETPFLTVTDAIEGIGWQPEIIKYAFEAKLKSISPLFSLKNSYFIFEKIKEKKAYTPALKDIYNKIKAAFKAEKARGNALSLAEKIIGQIKNKNAKSLKKIAKTSSLPCEETEYFSYFGYVNGIGMQKEFNSAAFSLKTGEILLKPIILPQGVYIIQLTGRKQNAKEPYAKAKEKYKSLLLMRRRLQELNRTLNSLADKNNLQFSASYF